VVERCDNRYLPVPGQGGFFDQAGHHQRGREQNGITKTKAEMAVETVFESMKKALEQGDASSCEVSEFSM